eukprot:585892-Pleurochrysis_carterae.AAC.1
MVAYKKDGSKQHTCAYCAIQCMGCYATNKQLGCGELAVCRRGSKRDCMDKRGCLWSAHQARMTAGIKGTQRSLQSLGQN